MATIPVGASPWAIAIGPAAQPPAVTITGPQSTDDVYAVNTPVAFTGSFTDAPGATHTATWTFTYTDVSGNLVSTSTAGTVVENSAGGGSVTASYSFPTDAVYNVQLTVTNNSGLSGTANTVDGLPATVVVYNPSAGFVTGGGWIQSNPGAYASNPSLTGQASFGFVSKYQNGATAPTGNTQFTFALGSLDFRSTSYQWLVVSGPMAQYKGYGTINGSGNYQFILTARDGALAAGGGADGFRIKIMDSAGSTLIYDNMAGIAADDRNTTANVQAIGGGSIQIHN